MKLVDISAAQLPPIRGKDTLWVRFEINSADQVTLDFSVHGLGFYDGKSIAPEFAALLAEMDANLFMVFISTPVKGFAILSLVAEAKIAAESIREIAFKSELLANAKGANFFEVFNTQLVVGSQLLEYQDRAKQSALKPPQPTRQTAKQWAKENKRLANHAKHLKSIRKRFKR